MSSTFHGPKVRPSVAAWALLAAGIVSGMHGVEQMEAARTELTEAQAAVKRLERARRQAGAEATAATITASARAYPQGIRTAPMLDEAGWRHAAELARGLSYPWRASLDGIDRAAAAKGAALMRFSLDLSGPASAQPEAQLQAAVRDEAHALQWLSALGPAAYLRSHERMTTPVSTVHGVYAMRVALVVAGGAP
ncbi:MAG: hypothetical protein QM742_15635 [Aquabacterium sp.]